MAKELKKRYGNTALIAGGSEGIGAAFAEFLAREKVNLILIARNESKLLKTATYLEQKYGVSIKIISCDLAQPNASQLINAELKEITVDIFIYNAALSYIGNFENNTIEKNNAILQVNVRTFSEMVHTFGSKMLKKGKGAIIIMSSLAGFQGSGFLTTYASTKAFGRILAESLWYEWKDKGVDIITCCAGATATPNYLATNPESKNFFAPKVQKPIEIVDECFKKLGKTPSFISGNGNKWASFIMQHLLPRKVAIKIMGDTTKKMYRL